MAQRDCHAGLDPPPCVSCAALVYAALRVRSGRGLNGRCGSAAQGFVHDPSSRVSAFEQPLGPWQARRAWRRSDARNRLRPHRAESKPEERPVMPLYEHVFLARQDVTPQQVETMIDQYKGVIEQNGGTVDEDRDVGRQVPRLPDQEEPQGAFHAVQPRRARRPRSPRWSARCASARTSCAS